MLNLHSIKAKGLKVYVREEASELHKLTNAYKVENSELKGKWEAKKLVLEKSKNEAKRS